MDIIASVVSALVCVLTILYGSRAMVYTHNYNETRKWLKDKYDKFEIIDVFEKNAKVPDYGSCEYIFNVKLEDSSNVIFHAGYCDIATFMTDYEVVDDWSFQYLPYYLEQYNIEHNASIRMEKMNQGLLDRELDRIYVNRDNAEDVKMFLSDFRKKANRMNNHFDVTLVNEEDGEEELYSSSSHFFPFYF